MSEKIKVLRDGKLIEEDSFTPDMSKAQTNEPLDRSKITDETKKELATLYKKLPEIKPVLEILLGKKEVENFSAKRRNR